MKIRIKSNSIRYRLTRTDVSALVSNKSLEEMVDFGEQVFTYKIQLTNDDYLTATYNNNTITMLMPVAMLNELQNTDKVGFENQSGKLYLLVEKDFTCLDNVAEDQSDNYPNPLAEK